MAIPKHISDLRELIGHRPILAPSVTAFVVSGDDDILVVKIKDDSSWTLPGGMVELGEAPLDALVREIREETGYIVHPKSILGVLGGHECFRRTYANGDIVEFVDTLYVCEIDRRETLRLDPEVLECKFRSIGSLGGWSYPLSAAVLFNAFKAGKTIFDERQQD